MWWVGSVGRGWPSPPPPGVTKQWAACNPMQDHIGRTCGAQGALHAHLFSGRMPRYPVLRQRRLERGHGRRQRGVIVRIQHVLRPQRGKRCRTSGARDPLRMSDGLNAPPPPPAVRLRQTAVSTQTLQADLQRPVHMRRCCRGLLITHGAC